MKALRNKKAKIFLTVFLVYLFYIAPGFIQAGTVRNIDLTTVMVDDKTFTIDKYDGNTIDISFFKGHAYIGGAPGMSFMATPIYAALKPLLNLIPSHIYRDQEFSILNLIFAFFLAVLPGALIAVLLYSILKLFGVEEKKRLLIVFASSFGTILFFYSTKFLSHTMTAFLPLYSFYVLYKARNESVGKISYFLAGLCMGLAVLSEYLLIISSLLLLAYFISDFKRHGMRNFLILLFGSLLIACIFMYYHYECFAGPFNLGVGHGGQYGDSIGMHPPKLSVMYSLTFGSYTGSFMFMPILLFGVYGIFVFFRKPERKILPEMIFITLYILITFIVISSYGNGDMGGTFGPRYLASILPFLAIPIAFALKKIKYKIVLWVALLSAFINWCGVQYGDADSVFTNIGLFIFRGLNSNLSEWFYKLVNEHVRKLNVITHFSPLIGLVILTIALRYIWKQAD